MPLPLTPPTQPREGRAYLGRWLAACTALQGPEEMQLSRGAAESPSREIPGQRKKQGRPCCCYGGEMSLL